MKKYCDDCQKIVRLTEDEYCTECGKHADNMICNPFINCEDCENEELNGWSSHCKTCNNPIVY